MLYPFPQQCQPPIGSKIYVGSLLEDSQQLAKGLDQEGGEIWDGLLWIDGGKERRKKTRGGGQKPMYYQHSLLSPRKEGRLQLVYVRSPFFDTHGEGGW